MEIIKEECIYDESVQYLRKGRWRKCQLHIDVMRRCQDRIVVNIKEVNDICVKITLFGYEGNNGFVSLIGCSDIILIKFDKLELGPQFIKLLKQYMKDVQYKIQLCKIVGFIATQSVLIVNEWYFLHVQTNRICLTTDSGNRLVAKWHRSNIGDCYIEDSSLNIEIVSKKEKCLYAFRREEKFALEKLFKAIKNLKFEAPLLKSEKFTSTPRRSGSVDLRRQLYFGNTKEKFGRIRTYSSSGVDDTISNDDSSPPSTPCSPLCIFGTNDPTLSLNNHIDEKDEELDDLMFSIDSLDTNSVTSSNMPKLNGHLVTSGSRELSSEFSNMKLVDLERFPFESDLKSQGKLSPELSTQSSNHHRIIYSYNPNINDKSMKSLFYYPMESLMQHRKTSSEANFISHQMEITKKADISHSVDVKSTSHSNFAISSSDKASNCSSPLRLQSSDNLSSDNQDSSKGNAEDDINFSRIESVRTCPSPHSYNGYYNIKESLDSANRIYYRPQLSLADSSQYYNLSHTLSSNSNNSNNNNYINISIDPKIFEPSRDSTVSYVELDFKDCNNSIASPRKVPPSSNYKEINIYETEVLRDLDNTLPMNIGKKKKSSFLKSFFKK